MLYEATDSANCLIRSPISSRTRWKTAHFSSSVPSAFAGSSNPQCSLLTCEGVIGQRSAASPQRVTANVALLRYSLSISSDSRSEERREGKSVDLGDAQS